MKIIWSPFARERVAEIAKYIASDSVAAAEKWVNSIFKTVKRLTDFPESGRVVPEINKREIREIIFGNYRIIYGMHEEEIKILTVRHGKQILLAKDLSKE